MKKIRPFAALLLAAVSVAAMADMNLDAASSADNAFTPSAQKIMQGVSTKHIGNAYEDFIA